MRYVMRRTFQEKERARKGETSIVRSKLVAFVRETTQGDMHTNRTKLSTVLKYSEIIPAHYTTKYNNNSKCNNILLLCIS